MGKFFGLLLTPGCARGYSLPPLCGFCRTTLLRLADAAVW
jgi:hypothetical protein